LEAEIAVVSQNDFEQNGFKTLMAAHGKRT
jgi:hypothetical protein